MPTKKKYTKAQKQQYYQDAYDVYSEDNASRIRKHMKKNGVSGHEFKLSYGIFKSFNRVAHNIMLGLFYNKDFKKNVFKENYYSARADGENHQNAYKYAKKETKNHLYIKKMF